MIKICILTSVHSPFDIRIFHKEAKSLVHRGYDVSLIAQHHKYEVLDGIKIIPLTKPVNRFDRMVATARSSFRKALKIDADIYHFHDPELIPVGLMLKRFNKLVIYDVHEDMPRLILSKSYIPPMLHHLTSILLEHIEKTSKFFDGVITSTPFINKRFLALGTNAININNYPLISELSVSEKPWDDREKAACFIGGITRINGAFGMVDAVGKTKFKLILAGNIEPGIKKHLRKMPGWQKVETLGYVGREYVKATMARTMVGLVPCLPEPNSINALPIKMFEYMSSGIPVIASNFPLWKKIVEGAKCGVCVDPLDPDDISKAMQWIIEHPDEARQMGENGRRAAEEKYNWGMEEKKLIRLYDQISRQVN